MIIGAVIQQPDENLDYDVDFSSLVTIPGDSLLSAVASVTPAGLTVLGVVANDTTGKIWVSDGADGVTYIVTLTVTTTQGRVKQDELQVIIQETE